MGCHSYQTLARRSVLGRPGPSTRHPRGDPRPLGAVRQRTAGRTAKVAPDPAWSGPPYGQARRGGTRPRRDQGTGRAEPRRAVERRLRPRGDDARAGRGRDQRAPRRRAADRRDHRDAGAAGHLLHAGDRGAPGGRRLVLGREGQPGALAEPAGGCVGRRRLRAHGGGQPRGGGGQPRQRVPGSRPPSAAR